jgi:hypothetical protein
MKNAIAQTTEQELLKRAQFRPVFDEDGNLDGISQLEVETDRRLGAQAMRDLNDTKGDNDDVIDQDGWTMKQRRILATPAPNACHYLKASRKWNASTNEFTPSFTILLPYEVTWTLFELLFQGQYSVEVEDLTFESEEIMPSSEEYAGREPDNAPGRLIYARAQVRVKIHLKNGQTRSYDGVGVAYGDVPMNKIGNIFAINNARRTAEKGAVSDARREALSSIGQVFRRAFEDGDEMIKALENMLLEELRIRNKPAIQASRSSVAAPASRSKKVEKETQPEKVQKTAHEEKKSPKETQEQNANAHATVYFEVSDDEQIPVSADKFDEEIFDILVSKASSKSDLEALLNRNKRVIENNLKDKSIVAELKSGFVEDEDGIPDFGGEDEKSADETAASPASKEQEEDTKDEGKDVEEDVDAEGIEINPDGLSGKKILEKFIELFLAAKTEAELNAIIDANKAAARKLTPKQLGAMTEAKVKHKEKISE